VSNIFDVFVGLADSSLVYFLLLCVFLWVFCWIIGVWLLCVEFFMGRSEMFESGSGAPADGRFVFDASEARPASRVQSTPYRPGKREDSPAATSGDSFRFSDSGTHTRFTPLTENEGYPRGYNPARQREVISALSVTADDIRKYGHRAAGHMRDTLSEVHDVPRVGGYPGEMTTAGLARDDAAFGRSRKFVRSISNDVSSAEKARNQSISSAATMALRRPNESEEEHAERAPRSADFYNKQIGEHDARIAELRGVDQDVELGKAHQAVEDAAAAHVPGKEHLLISDARERLGPMEMEELGKALPKTSKKRDTAARKVKFSEMTGKARTVEAIARSTVPVEDLQGIKDAQLTRAADGRNNYVDKNGYWSEPFRDSWVSHVPSTLRRVLDAPKRHAMINLNAKPKGNELGRVAGPDIGAGPVNISRFSEPKTQVAKPPVTDANGRTTGSIYPVGTRYTTAWNAPSVNNAERQMFYPIPKGTPKAIADRRRQKASAVTETLIHELGHASPRANDNPTENNVAPNENPYRARGAEGQKTYLTSENDVLKLSGLMEAVAENYQTAHWRPDTRFLPASTRASSNYDSRYNDKYGAKNGANPTWRRTYANNRIDMTPPKSQLPKSRLEELSEEAPNG